MQLLRAAPVLRYEECQCYYPTHTAYTGGYGASPTPCLKVTSMLCSIQLASMREAFNSLVAKVLLARDDMAICIAVMDLPVRGHISLEEIDWPECIAPTYEIEADYAPAVASSDAVILRPLLRVGRPEQLEYG